MSARKKTEHRVVEPEAVQENPAPAPKPISTEAEVHGVAPIGNYPSRPYEEARAKDNEEG